MAQTEVLFKPMQVIFNTINQNVPDINIARANETNLKNKQWIFPTLPETFDENYPRIAIINDKIRFSEYGAGQFIGNNYQTIAGEEIVVSASYGKIAVMPVTIAIFVKKGQMHDAQYFDQTIHKIQNTKQIDYLASHVVEALDSNRINFIEKNMDINILDISRSYEDNDFLLACNITMEVTMFHEWSVNYDPIGFIKQIDLTFTIY